MMTSLRNRILTAILIFASLGAFSAKADLDSCGVHLGAAGPGQWAVFTLGSGVNPNVNMTGQSSVVGNVGAAGGGNVVLGSSQATIHGNLSYRSPGTLNNLGTITGSLFQDPETDAFLDGAANDALNAFDQAFGLTVNPGVTPPYQSLTNVKLSSGQNITIAGSGRVILSLNNFMISSGTFTLAGTAGTCYIINVSNQFSLSNSARIVLGTGILPQDVLFNVRGTGTQVNVGGNSQFNGILLATQRTVSITGSASVTGEVIANSVNMSGQSSVRAVSPTSNP